ncbi:hypothetical protein ACTFIZ_000197 [Dictyostelium cf. discoideum]
MGVVASNPVAAQAGFNILKQGGRAIDATIATQLVLNLVEPQSSGIGGGAFMVYYDGKEVNAFDGRETAPAAASEKLFYDTNGKPLSFYEGVVGGRSVSAPGILEMLALAHQRYGKLSWEKLFTPVIELAEQGFAIHSEENRTLKPTLNTTQI